MLVFQDLSARLQAFRGIRVMTTPWTQKTSCEISLAHCKHPHRVGHFNGYIMKLEMKIGDDLELELARMKSLLASRRGNLSNFPSSSPATKPDPPRLHPFR